MIRRPPRSTLFPTRRSSDLVAPRVFVRHLLGSRFVQLHFLFGLDRKSTRLNSSHVSISYAVFCLKKKNTTTVVILPFKVGVRKQQVACHFVDAPRTTVVLCV